MNMLTRAGITLVGVVAAVTMAAAPANANILKDSNRNVSPYPDDDGGVSATYCQVGGATAGDIAMAMNDCGMTTIGSAVGSLIDEVVEVVDG